jgi:hypothetical protein
MEPIKQVHAPKARKARIERLDMFDPKAQQHPDTPRTQHLARNHTQVHARIEGTWKPLHAHWSLTKPELRTH